MKPKALDEIPGVEDSELLAALQNLASLPETSTDAADRFGSEVRAIAEVRAQRGWAGEGDADVTVFLRTLYPRETGAKLGGVPVANLIASGRSVLGKLFLLNPDASHGHAINLPTDPDQIIDWLIAQGLGDQTVVFVYRETRMLLMYGRGANGEITRKDVVRDRSPVATLQEVGEALALSYKQHLIAPRPCPPNVWAAGRAREYVPGSEPEKAIQRQLGSDLRSWFHGRVRAEFEESIPLGRIDIRLLQLREAGWTYWVILELKVLRSNHHAPVGQKASPVPLAENVEAVVEGIRQVDAFAKHWMAEPLLEIFDLRKNKNPNILEDKLVIKELGKCQPVPNCRIWPLFGSAGDARRAMQ